MTLIAVASLVSDSNAYPLKLILFTDLAEFVSLMQKLDPTMTKEDIKGSMEVRSNDTSKSIELTGNDVCRRLLVQ